MRSNLLAAAIAAGLGLAGLATTDVAHAQSAADLAALKAQIAELTAKVEALEAQADAQSEVNVEQAKINETVAPAVDSLKKTVNDTKVSGRLFVDATRKWDTNRNVDTANGGFGFDVTRFYLAVDHRFNDIWSANLTSDAQYLRAPGASQENSVEVFIKKAYVQAKYGNNFFRVGSADAPWIPFVEKAYGMRYLQNTLTDRLSFGTSADWGFHAGGDFANGFGYAASLANGRGYRNPSRSKSVDFEARVSYAPTQNLMFGVGGYTGKRGNETELVDPPQTAQRVNVMAAYTGSRLRVGAEWFQADNWAVTNVVEDSAAGYSVWANYVLTNGGITAFARYDDVDTSKDVRPDQYNHYYHVGVEFPLAKGIKVATAYKYTHNDANSNNTNAETRELGVWGDIQF